MQKGKATMRTSVMSPNWAWIRVDVAGCRKRVPITELVGSPGGQRAIRVNDGHRRRHGAMKDRACGHTTATISTGDGGHAAVTLRIVAVAVLLRASAAG